MGLDADERRKTQFFFFPISEISVYLRPDPLTQIHVT